MKTFNKRATLLILSISLLFSYCKNKVDSSSDKANAIDSVDEITIEYVVERLLYKDVFMNSYIVYEMDLEDFYRDHKEWVLKYYPDIVVNYDLTLYTRFVLSMQLYLEGKKEYLLDLWSKYSRLSNEPDFEGIMYMLDYYKIDLDK